MAKFAETGPAGIKMTPEYYRKALLLGFGLFGAQLMWMIYNTYMPIFLQAGNPAFKARAGVAGFGLSATITGIIMTFDNIAAFFIQPIMGPVSDKTRTRIGRRMPYILVFAPLSALAFALIPLGPQLIPAGASGQSGAFGLPFAITMAAAIVMLLCMAMWRTPLFALLPDIFPSPLRSEANALVNIMSGVGGILAFVIGGYLFSLYQPLPFWFGSVATVAAVLILFWKVKEPKAATGAAEVEAGLKVFAKLREVPAENRKSLLLLILTVFCYQLGYNAVETFFSSYAVASLGLPASKAAIVLSVSYLSFLIFALPSGRIAGRFGRKPAIAVGLLSFALGLAVIRLFPSLPVVIAMLFVGGFGWALVNINCFPMILDTSTSEELSGTYSGLYFVASTLAGTLGPILNGWLIDLAGRDYSMIFVVSPAFFLLSFLCVLGVSKGEVKTAAAAIGETGPVAAGAARGGEE
jgi:MFS family permease